MRIGCLILAHKNPLQIEKLIRAMDHPAFDIYVHVDGKIPTESFVYLEEYERVFLIRNRVKVYWGKYSLVQATLDGIAEVLDRGQYEYVHVMSAQDFPIKSPSYFYQFLCERKGQEFITCLRESDGHEWWKDAALHTWRYNFHNWSMPGKYRLEALANRLLPRRKYPVPGHEVVGHSNWFTITSGSARYMLAYLKEHGEVVRFFRYVWGADELIFSTVIYNNPAYRDKVEENLVYIDWSERVANPKLLTMGDLSALLASDKIFARKFDMEKDAAVLDELERVIGED